MGLYTYLLKVVKKMKAKALTSFFSKEHGSVSIGDTMNFQNAETMADYVNAGYVEEMSDDMAVPTQAPVTEAPKATKASRKAKATANDVEFSQELGAVEAQTNATAQKASRKAQATANATAQDVEFSQELGAVSNAQHVAEAQAHEAQVAKNAQEMNDMNENNQ
jgi:hypothetical protein